MLAAGLALAWGQTAGQNTKTAALRVWMDDITVTADGTTATRLTVYENDAERDYTAFNMSIIVPQGITVKQVKKGRNWVNSIELSERAAETHNISCNMPDATTLKVMCSSTQNDDLYPDDEGGNPMDELFYIDLVADAQMVNGTYTVTTEGVVFAHNDNNTVKGYEPDPLPSFQLTITGGQNALTVPYTLTSAGIGTLCLPFAADVPNGLQVYTGTAVVGSQLQLARQTSIAAGVPLLVMGTAGTYQFQGVPSVSETEWTEGVLSGTTAQRQLSEGYVLQTLSGVTGFYRVDSERPVTMPAYRAWLNYSDESEAKMVRIDFTTAIGSTVSGQSSTASDVYDMGGRKVADSRKAGLLQKGVYVVDGQKRVKREH